MKKTFFLCLVLIAMGLNSCKKETAPATYLGTWKNGDTQLIFNADKTYTLTNPTTTYTGSGTYNLGERQVVDEMTLRDKGSVCGDSIPGYYKFKYLVPSTSGTGTFYQTLTMNLVSDTCLARAAALQGTYTLVKE